FGAPPNSFTTPSASNTAKTMASFISNSTNTSMEVNASSSNLNINGAAPSNPEALNYYLSLRGLNVSLMSAVTQAVDIDPFIDVAAMLERYKSLRQDVQSKFDSKATSAMPQPPTSFAGFAGFSSGGATPTQTTDSSASTPSAFTFSTSAPSSPFNAAKEPAAASTSLFGSSSSSSSSPFGKSTFGSPATSTFGTNPFSTSTSETPASSSNPFLTSTSAFGAKPTTSAFGGFGGFGKTPSPGLGSSVGFAFGTTPKATEESQETVSTEEESSQGEKPEVHQETTTSLLGHNPHDEEGEGEEDETTTHSVKLKVFKFKGKEWVDMGVGMLRLKKHNTDGSRRIFLRNSNTGKIVINFQSHEALDPKPSGTTVRFMGHEDGGPQLYNVRAKTADQAQALKEALDREIEFVKAKSDD
ncbi:hypothetical protein C8J56DRAFT_777591, partial [Mycena floridula]